MDPIDKGVQRYPDELSDALLNEHEFLVAVEQTVSIAKEATTNEEECNLAIMFHLGVLCYIQGIQLAVENLKREGKLNDASVSSVDRQVMAILCGQTRWEFAEAYCKNLLGVQINPIGLLVVLKRISSDDSGENDKVLSEAVDEAARIIESQAKGDLASIGKPPETIPADIGINLESELIPTFFSLLEEIGTFYIDRDKYETDEQRELHDKIISIYQKISE